MRDPGTWSALGVATLFVIAGVVMHRVIVNVLKNGGKPSSESEHE